MAAMAGKQQEPLAPGWSGSPDGQSGHPGQVGQVDLSDLLALARAAWSDAPGNLDAMRIAIQRQTHLSREEAVRIALMVEREVAEGASPVSPQTPARGADDADDAGSHPPFRSTASHTASHPARVRLPRTPAPVPSVPGPEGAGPGADTHPGRAHGRGRAGGAREYRGGG